MKRKPITQKIAEGKAKVARRKAKEASIAARATAPANSSRPSDLVKPSVLAKELGTYLSVIYGMIKRGTIKDYRTPTDQSSLVSRAEVEAARSGARSRARRGAVETAGDGSGTPEAPKSPLRKGQILLAKRHSSTRRGPEGAQTTLQQVTEVMEDSETGMAMVHDSNGRELFYTASDATTLLAQGRLLEVQPGFILDVLGRHFVDQGRDDLAQSLADWAAGHLNGEAKEEEAPLVGEVLPKHATAGARKNTKNVTPLAKAGALLGGRKMTAVERQRAKRGRK